MFIMPHELMPDVKKMEAQLDKINRDISAFVPKEWQGAANLMAHPFAASAAMTALGAGVASQAFGLWMGSVVASMDATQRMAALAMPELEPEADSIPAFMAPKSAAVRMKAAAETFAADLEVAAGDVAEVGLEVAKDFASEAEQVIEAVSKRAVAVPADETAVDEKTVAAVSVPEGPVKPAAMERPETVDDLKAISGVGPKLEQVLNGLGIWTYAQVAAFGEGEIAWLDDHLGFRGRIGRDDWIGQAKGLAGKRG
jgi:NADH-quinone oxidoreductase subunit E